MKATTCCFASASLCNNQEPAPAILNTCSRQQSCSFVSLFKFSRSGTVQKPRHLPPPSATAPPGVLENWGSEAAPVRSHDPVSGVLPAAILAQVRPTHLLNYMPFVSALICAQKIARRVGWDFALLFERGAGALTVNLPARFDIFATCLSYLPPFRGHERALSEMLFLPRFSDPCSIPPLLPFRSICNELAAKGA